MATSKLVSRLSSRLHPLALRITKPTLSSPLNAASPRRVSCISRLPVELGCSGSMMPLHSAVASARLVSSLSTESWSWGLVPQGISMPL
ncbi:uncharacterized protein LOC129293145 [Prosopis cineraria]|uniref:uncharacterized protein LOC129293145 n=1 Tax=Prosopis cineraria TaxID=364024 RepID=UPI00240F37E3|nr:uncharacterized protein LOC129293145 [Prosopis cineraria]